MKQGSRSKPMIGLRFGRLVVVDIGEPIYANGKINGYKYICKCDCGNTKMISGNSLRTNHSKSCGCLNKEKPSNHITHHLSETSIYYKYKGMKSRCYNKNCSSYKYYGGRGIVVCEEWLGNKGFETFHEWAINNGYTDGLSLERIDVNGNYEPNNCKWIPFKDQAHNKTNTVYKDGVSVSQVTRNIGIVPPHIARARIKKFGWSLYDATHTPVGKKRGEK